jgi:hypothetical protein
MRWMKDQTSSWDSPEGSAVHLQRGTLCEGTSHKLWERGKGKFKQCEIVLFTELLKGQTHFLQWKEYLYHQESIVIFPSQNNNNIQRIFGVLQPCALLEIFSSAPGRPDDPRQVSSWPSVSESCDWVLGENQPPPLQNGHWTAYLTPFLRLNPQTLKRCHMDLWSACLVLIHLHLLQLHPFLLQLQPMEPRVRVLSFNLDAFSLAGCLLLFLCFSKELPFGSLLLQ